MPPRVHLSDQESHHLPQLLQFQPPDADAFQECRTIDQRLLWILSAYEAAIDPPLTAPLITLLLFKHGPNIALRSVVTALRAAIAAGAVKESDAGFILTQRV